MKRMRAVLGILFEWPFLIQLGTYWCVWLRTPWFRVGILGNESGFYEPMFSERYGHTKVWRFRWCRIKYVPLSKRVSSEHT